MVGFMRVVLAGSALAGLPAIAQLHSSDIAVGVVDGRIVTGVIDPDTGTPAFPWSVYLGTFGDLGPGFENFTSDPGFDSLGVFAPGTKIGFDILRALRSWDGSGFSTIPAETIVIAKGGQQAQTPASDSVVAGFVFGEANAGGKFHHHVGYTLTAPHASGVYLLELRLWSPTLEESKPFWIVFNQNEDPGVHQQAAQWVLDNLATCRPDCEGDGDLDVFDYLCFLGRFSVQDPYADFEGDGDWDVFDFLAYQGSFAQGC